MKSKSLRNIIGIVSLASILSISCGIHGAKKPQLEIPLPGTVEKKATYTIQAYDQNKNGYCDKYKVIGSGMIDAEVGLKAGKEIPATEIQFKIEELKGLVDRIEFY